MLKSCLSIEGGGGGGGERAKTKCKTPSPNSEELIESITNIFCRGVWGKRYEVSKFGGGGGPGGVFAVLSTVSIEDMSMYHST